MKVKKFEIWYWNGQVYRKTGPSLLSWKSNGIKSHIWYKNTILQHPTRNLPFTRKGGPCSVKYNSIWIKIKHKIDGPAEIIWDEKGNIITKKWYLNGYLHNDNGAAIIEWYKHGAKKSKEWYKKGKLHREKAPAKIMMYGCMVINHWYLEGKRHREDGPAITGFMKTIKCKDKTHLKYELWYLHGRLHRVDGPAKTEHDSSTTVQLWYLEGNLHRADGPACTYWSRGGIKDEESWYMNGKLHRVGGPAETLWYDNGSIDEENWYWKGNKIIEWETTSHRGTI